MTRNDIEVMAQDQTAMLNVIEGCSKTGQYLPAYLENFEQVSRVTIPNVTRKMLEDMVVAIWYPILLDPMDPQNVKLVENMLQVNRGLIEAMREMLADTTGQYNDAIDAMQSNGVGYTPKSN
jgi:hypothetical protein